MTHVEIGDRRGLRKLVPRTYELTIVAAIHAVADQRTHLDRNAALQARSSDRRCSRRASTLYGPTIAPVGHASMQREQLPQWRARRLGRTSGDVSASGRQRHIDVDFAEKKQRARVALRKQRMFAAPADAGLLRKLDFEHRRRVGKHADNRTRRSPPEFSLTDAADGYASPCDSRGRAA